MKVEISAPGKIFLSGEYFALDGGLATILSTKQRVNVVIDENSGPNNIFYTSAKCKSFPFTVDDEFRIKWIENDPKEYGSFIKHAIKQMEIRPLNSSFFIDSSKLYHDNKKIGIGSSAAISSALVKAINTYFDLQYNRSNIIDMSIELHKINQDNRGSGLDVISSIADCDLIECDKMATKQKTWTAITWPNSLFISGVITNQSSSTSQMLERYQKGKILNEEFFKTVFSDAKEILKELSFAWQLEDTNLIISFMEEYNMLIHLLNEKFDLQIFSREHQFLMQIAKQLGIFYKPSGAGGGDLGIVLSNDKEKFTQFFLKLTDSNFRPINLR